MGHLWPARSPDLTPLSSWLYLENVVYSTFTENEAFLMKIIVNICQIRPNFLLNTINTSSRRFQLD